MPRTAEQAARVFVSQEVLGEIIATRRLKVLPLAVKADVSPAVIYNILSGRSPGSAKVQERLARALKIDPTELEG